MVVRAQRWYRAVQSTHPYITVTHVKPRFGPYENKQNFFIRISTSIHSSLAHHVVGPFIPVGVEKISIEQCWSIVMQAQVRGRSVKFRFVKFRFWYKADSFQFQTNFIHDGRVVKRLGFRVINVQSWWEEKWVKMLKIQRGVCINVRVFIAQWWRVVRNKVLPSSLQYLWKKVDIIIVS